MKIYLKTIFAIVAFGVAVISLENNILDISERIKYSKVQILDEDFRADFCSDEQFNHKNLYSEACKSILTDVENDAIYYPVAESSVDKALNTSYVNSWMAERNFGGKRGHEGVDIMASKDIQGLYPIVSMTNGVITNLGWLEKGGYRVGITSDSGIYYYYAHLDSYANLTKGQRVKAGELLGYMGNSGYGPEGTKGKFAVHLHLGIYVYDEGKEISMNPYYILRKIEKKTLKCSYF